MNDVELICARIALVLNMYKGKGYKRVNLVAQIYLLLSVRFYVHCLWVYSFDLFLLYNLFYVQIFFFCYDSVFRLRLLTYKHNIVFQLVPDSLTHSGSNMSK